MQRPKRKQLTRTKKGKKASGRRVRKNHTRTDRHSFHSKQKKKLLQVMVLAICVLVILVTDAYRRGEVKLYQEKPAVAEKEKKKKKSVLQAEEKAGADLPTEKPEQNIDEQQIRILISTTNFSGFYHDIVTVKGSKEITVSEGKKTNTYPAGEEITFQKEQKYSGKLRVKVEKGGKIQICSITRQDRLPNYRGDLEIRQTGQGFTVINELPLGEYLYAVVPSELSTSHKMEALKAQAVCARTYAYHQLQSDRFEEYGADMDDSTSSQVYNNIPEDKRSRKAVKVTSGEIVTRDGDPVVTYYYSTSWGKSASGREVWNTSSELPYLQSCMQTEGQENGSDRDLSNDEAFRNFLSQDTAVTYDCDADWYRWNVTIPSTALEQSMDGALQNCYQNDPSMVLTQDQEGKYKKQALRSIGKLRKIRVDSRGKSGLVTAVVVVGSENVVKVCGQYNIRYVLSPGSAKIHYGAGETTMTLLPSAAFYLDRGTDSDGNVTYVIHGGGCGHGTGMSQCGASQMAEQGKGYQDILKYYFSGCEVASKSISR